MTTKHTHPPNYGKKVEGCPRCEELAAGAEPVRWAISRSRRDAEDDAQRVAESRAHFAPGGPHSLANCGPVCTFGDW
jgi:hypothetical protein